MNIFPIFVSLLTFASRHIKASSTNLQFCKQFSVSSFNMTEPTEYDYMTWLDCIKSIVPKLSNDRHKGQAGRIGVVGGSIEYTGAPYFTAISALKVGADLAHVFCTNAAAPVIKSYSPELIVHPLLDLNNSIEKIEEWLHRLHVIVIGPGLGRDPKILSTAAEIIEVCRRLRKPLVIDADGLFLITQNTSLIKDYPGVILTPNVAEFSRLFGNVAEDIPIKMKELGSDVTIIEKGVNDRIYDSVENYQPFKCPSGGSGRRCGGQGDLMSGAIATFYHWALENDHSNPEFIASFAGSFLAKKCNELTFKEKGRSMLVTDMIERIHSVFDNHFENKV